MPRIAKSEKEKRIDNIARVIRHHYDDSIRERGISCKTAAKSLGITYGTLANRFKSPRDFRIGELIDIANAMNISIETLISGKEAQV